MGAGSKWRVDFVGPNAHLIKCREVPVREPSFVRFKWCILMGSFVGGGIEGLGQASPIKGAVVCNEPGSLQPQQKPKP